MAGTVSVDYRYDEDVKRLEIEWTSDASGDATATFVDKLNGQIIGVQFIYDDTDTPTDLYDVTITDEEGIDVLQSVGVDLPNDSNPFYIPTILDGASGSNAGLVPVEGILNFAVANAGNAKSGIVVLFVR